MICHNDLFPPNVIFRDGLARRADRLGPRGAGAAPLRRRVGGELLGSARPRGAQPERVRALARAGRASGSASSATATGSTPPTRIELLDVVAHRNRMGYEIHRRLRRRAPAARLARDVGRAAAATRSSSGALGSRRTAPTCNDPSHEPRTDHRRRHRLGRAGHRRAPPRAARERRARAPARRHRHVRALRRPAPLRRLPHRPGRLGSRASPPPSARSSRREGADCVLPQSSFDLEGLAEHRDTFPVPVLVSKPDAIFRSNDKAETLRVPPPARPARAGVPARQRRLRGRGCGARARLPRRAGVLQAGVLVGVARLPDPRPDGRPGAPAAERAARARSRCASRRRSSCSPPRAGPICS